MSNCSNLLISNDGKSKNFTIENSVVENCEKIPIVLRSKSNFNIKLHKGDSIGKIEPLESHLNTLDKVENFDQEIESVDDFHNFRIANIKISEKFEPGVKFGHLSPTYQKKASNLIH